MTYRAGIIGCGRIGCGFDDDPRRGYVSTHAGAYVRTPGVELVALCDVNPQALDRYGEKFGVRGRYADFDQMLAAERLDIVSICTWNNTHRELVEKAVDAGVKAVFCEKPIAESLSAADAMIQKCSEHNVILMIDHQRRFDQLHQEVAAYLRDGRLGRIQQVTCYYTAGVANTGTHLFDLLRFFFGEAEWAQGIHSRNRSGRAEDPNIDGWLQMKDGPLVALQSCEVQSYTIFEVDILGTLGRLRLAFPGFGIQYEGVAPSPRFSEYRELRLEAPPTAHTEPGEFMLQAIVHLLNCLERGERPPSSGLDGRRALEIICALRESAEAHGRRIGLPLESSPITVQSR